MQETDTPTVDLDELRHRAVEALKDFFEAGTKAGHDIMLLAGQFTREMQELFQ